MAKRRDKGEERGIATARIRRLLDLAGREPAYADRYASLAWRLAQRYQTGLPPEAKGRVCRACGSLLVPGRTATVRVSSGRVVSTCRGCGAIRRRPLR